MALCIVPSCLDLRMSQQLVNPGSLHQEARFWGCRRHLMKVAHIVRARISPTIKANANGLRVFVLSDLHTDYSENMAWVRGLSRTVGQNKDVLLVAGDVAETHDNFVLTMSLLRDKFAHVFFVPGNHDLWLRREKDNSACKDYHACRWPAGLINGDTSLALYIDAMNEKHQEKVREMLDRRCQIISFSHFVPRQELCPEKRMLFYPNLPKIAGSDFLEARIRSIHGGEGSASACHVFGHTHFCWDAVLDGIRYVQAPLAYPREQKRRMNGGDEWLPYCIYSAGELSKQRSPCYWSDYYAVNPRTPHLTQLAPWVASFYHHRRGRSSS